MPPPVAEASILILRSPFLKALRRIGRRCGAKLTMAARRSCSRPAPEISPFAKADRGPARQDQFRVGIVAPRYLSGTPGPQPGAWEILDVYRHNRSIRAI